MIINGFINGIIKFIYAQIFSRVDIRHKHATINKVSEFAAPIFTRAPLKCKIKSVAVDGMKGEWSGLKGLNTGRYIFFIHGGGFSLFSTNFYREMVGRIALAAEARAVVQLSSGTEAPFSRSR